MSQRSLFQASPTGSMWSQHQNNLVAEVRRDQWLGCRVRLRNCFQARTDPAGAQEKARNTRQAKYETFAGSRVDLGVADPYAWTRCPKGGYWEDEYRRLLGVTERRIGTRGNCAELAS